MARIPQFNFTRGEISEDLLGREDTQGYADGLRKLRNGYVHQYGGVSNRPGLKFIAPCRTHDRKVRLIPFEFGPDDMHVIELGHEYYRILRNDGHLLEDTVAITGATAADPVVITAVAHGYATGDDVFIQGVTGMTEINGRQFRIAVLSTDTFSLAEQMDGVDLDGTGFTAYVSGGTVARLLTVATPYQEDELFYIKLNQSFDVVTMVHPNHTPRRVRRLALNNWDLQEITFEPLHAAPAGLSAAAVATSTTTVRYAVTATAEDTGEESLPALSATEFTITGVTQANPAVVTFGAGPGLNTGHEIFIKDVVGMTELNGRRFRVSKVTATTYQLQATDSTGFTAYTSGGKANPAFHSLTNSEKGTSTDNNVSWSPVPGTSQYTVYKERNGVFGFLGDTSDTAFNDDGEFNPDVGDTAPFFRNPFLAAGNQPGAIGSHEQRRVYGGTGNDPERIVYSQINAVTNFTQASPLRADDAFITALPARRVNEVRHLVSFEDLIVLTNSSVWRVTSGEQRFSFDTIRQLVQTEIGASQRPPLIVDQYLVFEEERSERVIALSFSFADNKYVPRDLTLLSPHVLRGDRMADWGFLSWPDPLLLCCKVSGKALSLTFNPEEQAQVTGWAQWETDGDFESVAVIRTNPTKQDQSPYFVVRRDIDGNPVRYIEKLETRLFDQIEEAFFVDCGLSFDVPVAITGVSAADPCVVTAVAHGFSDGDFIDIEGIEWEKEFDENFNLIVAGGTDQLNGRRYQVENATANTFELRDVDTTFDIIDGTDFPAYVSGGKVRRAVDTLRGFHHLRGRDVVALADGDVIRELTVAADGSLAFPRRISRAQVGLPYICDIETLPVSSLQAQISGVRKKISEVILRFLRTRGALIGNDPTDLNEWKQREYESYGQPTQLFTGDVQHTIAPLWSRKACVFIRQKDPLPLTLLAILPDIEA